MYLITKNPYLMAITKNHFIYSLLALILIVGCTTEENLLQEMPSDQILETQNLNPIPPLGPTCGNINWQVEHSVQEGPFVNVEGSTIDICGRYEDRFRFSYESALPGGPSEQILWQIWHPNPNATAAQTQAYFQNLDNLGVRIRSFVLCLA
ncbi:MAG: hypothetical protein AAFQ98_16850, partial [Bacteroidota bacterium]